MWMPGDHVFRSGSDGGSGGAAIHVEPDGIAHAMEALFTILPNGSAVANYRFGAPVISRGLKPPAALTKSTKRRFDVSMVDPDE